MNIAAAELKRHLKMLSPLKTETYQISPAGISAQDSDALVMVNQPLGLGGAFNISGKKLGPVVNRMSGQIEITREERSLILKSSKARIELEIPEVKPTVWPEDPDKQLTIPLPEFKKALSVAVSSASPNKSAAFGGVVQIQSMPLGIEDETSPGYRIVGTDSLVLTLATVKTPVFEFKTLLNLTAASVVQLMDGPTLFLGETNKHVQISCGNTTVYATRPSQKYPSFDALLSPEVTTKLRINPEEFLSAIRTVEPLIDDLDKGHISLLFQEGVVQCKSIGVGNTASDEATYEQIFPDPVFEPVKIENLRLLAKHLTGFLGRAGKEATISFVDKTKPVRMESEGVVVLTMPFVTKGTK